MTSSRALPLLLLLSSVFLAGPAMSAEKLDIAELAFKLEEAKPGDKDQALRNLGNTMDPAAATALLALLADNKEDILPNTKALALKLAMRVADKRALPALKTMMDSPDPQVREWAVRVLPYCETPEAVEMVKAAMRDGERLVRLAAVESLGNASDPALFDFLDKLAADGDSGVAGAAQAARLELAWRLGRVKRLDYGRYLGFNEYVPIACVGVLTDMFKKLRGQFLHVYNAPKTFTEETIAKDLPDFLAKCRLLCFASGGKAATMMCTEAPLVEAVKRFLQQGGTLYIAGQPDATAEKFLRSIQVYPPQDAKGGAYSAIPSDRDPHPVIRWPFQVPRQVSDQESSLSWGAWHEKQTAPYRHSSQPARAAMLIQENVLGKGRVIFCGMSGMWESDQQRHADMVENLLATAFGESDRAVHYYFLFRPGQATPHTAWGRPWAGAKPKVLFLGDRYTHRDILELMQRAEFEYEYATLLTRREGSYGRACDALEGASVADIKQKLAGEYDCIVIAERYREKKYAWKHWQTLPEEVRRFILRRVRQGVGLVVLDTEGDEESQELRDLPVEKTDFSFTVGTLPWDLNAKRRDYEMRNETVLTRRAGEGHVAFIKGLFRPDYGDNRRGIGKPALESLTTPGIVGPRVRFRPHDYAFSLYWQCVLWAAKKQPEVRFHSVEPESPHVATFAKPAVVMELHNAGKEPRKVRVVVTAVDKLTRTEATARGEGALPAGQTTRLRVEMPPLKSGYHVMHVSARDEQDRVLNWANAAVQVDPGVSLASADFDKPVYVNGDTIRAKLALKGAIPAPGVKLKASLRDTHGRLMAQYQQDLAAGVEAVEVALPVQDPVALLADLRVELEHASGPVAAEEYPVALAPPRTDVEDFKWYVWRNGTREDERPATARLGVDYASGSATPDAEVSLRACSMLWACSVDNLIIGSDGVEGDQENGRRPCMTNPGYEQKIYDYCKDKLVSFYSRLGVHDYMLADEERIGGTFCSSPSCRFHFGRWLERTYGSLEALNRAWGTSFKDWREVKAPLLDDVKDVKRVGGFTDHRRYMDSVFTARVRRYREVLESLDPESRTGLSGTQYQSPWANLDWWQLCRAGNFWTAYGSTYGSAQTLLRRSFKTRDTIMAQWTGGYDRTDRHEQSKRLPPWEFLFNGYDAYAYYWGGSDAFIMMNPDLTPCNIAQWVGEEIRLLKGGLAKLILRSQLETFGIALHYSPASHYSSYPTASAQLNRPGHIYNLINVARPAPDLGRQLTYVAYQQIELGDLISRRFRLLLLPASQAISKREAEEIRKFVAEGGTVVADFAVAQRDEHGAWQGGGLLADVFGFTVAKPESEFRLSRLKLPQPFGKTPAGEVGLFHACYGDGLAVQSAKPLAEVEALSLDEEKEFAKSVGQDKGRFPARHKSTRAPSIAPGARGPALLVNRFGKGNAVYLNFTLEAYVQAMRVPGFEEEFTEAQRVNLERGEKVRALFESILDLAGVPNPAAMTRVDGRKEFPPLYLHRNGEAWYLGFYPAEGQSDPMDWNLRDAYRLRMPAAGHLYDSREGKYVGQGQEADVKPVRGVAYVYACLPYKVEGIEAQAGPAQAGERLQGKARIVAADAKPCEHVLRLTVFDPSGAERSAYAANVVAKDGQVEFGFRLARDDPKGAWTLRLRDAATGVTGEGRFEVR